MVNKRTVNGPTLIAPSVQLSVGRAAAADGRCVTMNGSLAGRPRRLLYWKRLWYLCGWHSTM